MTFGPALDVAIGLMLVYLLLGLIVSAFQEVLSTWLTLRGKYLRDAIAGLLAGGNATGDLFQKVYGHALVQGTASGTLPSYVPSRNFTLALIDTITDGSSAPVFGEIERKIAAMPDGPVKQTLRVFVQQAGGDLDALKSDLARWYDDAMDRLSGKYKRFSQIVAIAAGLIIAVALNVDSIRISKALWDSETLRQQTVTAAEAFKKPEAPAAGQAEKELTDNVNQLFQLDLPIGWQTPYTFQTPSSGGYFAGAGLAGILLAILGWLITGLATSLGAPFWFDTLQRFLKFRGTGAKPPKAAEEGTPA